MKYCYGINSSGWERVESGIVAHEKNEPQFMAVHQLSESPAGEYQPALRSDQWWVIRSLARVPTTRRSAPTSSILVFAAQARWDPQGSAFFERTKCSNDGLISRVFVGTLKPTEDLNAHWSVSIISSRYIQSKQPLPPNSKRPTLQQEIIS
jgi:hypothetical protein